MRTEKFHSFLRVSLEKRQAVGPSFLRNLDFFQNRRFPVFKRPCGRLFFENNDFPLCLCCPAGGLFLKNRDLFYLYNFLHIAKLANFRGFEPREYPRTLSFEK